MKCVFFIFILINISVSFADKKCVNLVRELVGKADSPSQEGVLNRKGFSSRKEYNRDDPSPIAQSIRNDLLPIIERRVKQLNISSVNERLEVLSMSEKVIAFLDYLLGRKLNALSLEELNELKQRASSYDYEKEELFLEFMKSVKTLTIAEINRLYFDYARDHNFRLIYTIPPTVLTALGILAAYPDFDFRMAVILSFGPVLWGIRGNQDEFFKKKYPYKGVDVLSTSFMAMFSSALTLGVASKIGVDFASMGVSDPVLTGAVVGLEGFTLGVLSDYISFRFSKNKKRLRKLMMYLQQRHSLSDSTVDP